MRVIVWGGSYQAKVITPILRENDLNPIAVFDDSPTLPQTPYPWVPIYRGEDFKKWIQDIDTSTPIGSVVTVAWPNGEFREDKYVKLLGWHDILPAGVISKDAIVLGNVMYGCMIMQGAIVQSGAEIGPYALINTGAIVEHDCKLGVGCEVAPGAVLLGCVRMESYSTVFSNATVFPHVKIGYKATVGAGAVVTQDVPPYQTWAGNPAKRIK